MDDPLKALWHRQAPAAMPDITQLVRKAGDYKKKQFRKLLLNNILLAGTAVFIGYIWYAAQPQFLSTKIGIVLAILAILVFLVASGRIFPLLKDVNTDVDSRHYLQQLRLLKERQLFLQKKLMTGYFILLTAGMSLYLYEYTVRMSRAGMFFTYGLTLAWIAFAWFYIKPRTVKKQSAPLNELIGRFEAMDRQLAE